MHYRRVFEPGASYFFTVVTHLRRPLFADSDNIDLLRRCIADVKARHPFEIDAFVILPDHLHMAWSLPEGDAGYSMRWNLIKAMFTRHYARGQPMPSRSESRIAKREQAVWQRRFWEHLIRDEADFSNHLDYIHLNPVQHGLVLRAALWPHSSFATWVERGRYAPNWGVDTVPRWPAWMLDWN